MRAPGLVFTLPLTLSLVACGDDGSSSGDTGVTSVAATASEPTASEPTASEPTASTPTTSSAGTSGDPSGDPTSVSTDVTGATDSSSVSDSSMTAPDSSTTAPATSEATSDETSDATTDATTDVTAGTTDSSNPDSPAPLTDLDVDPTNAANFLSWLPPDDPDLAGVLVLRRAGAPVVAVPADGVFYNPGELLGDSEVIYASDGANLLDAPLTNGTTYHYRLYAFDVAGNYAVGVSGVGTPYDPHPANYAGYTIFQTADTIEAVDLVLDSQDQLHLAVVITKPGGVFVHYARCTSGCDGPDDWTVTQLSAKSQASGGLRITLDAQDRPRIAYRTDGSDGAFLSCNQSCEVAGNWTALTLFDGANDYDLFIDENNATWMFATGDPTRFARCTNGCSNLNNWTIQSLPLSSSYMHEGAYRADRMALPVAHWTGQNYDLHVLSCTGACEDPATWTDANAGSTQGSIGNAPYRVDAWGGAQLISSQMRRYGSCKACAPALPPFTYTFNNDQLYNDGLLELSAEGHARIVATKSSGKYHYMTCDYHCDVPEQWIETPALDASSFVRFRLASDGMPVIIYAPYGDNNQLLVRRGL